MAFGQQLVAQVPGPVERLNQQDVRLAQVAERMQGANRELCRLSMPLTGLVLHSRDQYRVDPGSAFENGAVAVAGVVPGSTAAAAAIMPGDGLAEIGDEVTSAMTAAGEARLRDTAFAALAEQAPPVHVTVVRGSEARNLSLDAPRGCRVLVEIRAAESLQARSDGIRGLIQVNYGLARRATDDELAVIFAHELGHFVLEHRRRLSEAGVEKGFFGEFGRNRRLNRQVEVEADRISVYLLANAGYDPAIAPAFWRSPLGRRVSGILRSGTYPSAKARAELMEQEIAAHLQGGTSYPADLMAMRDTPFARP